MSKDIRSYFSVSPRGQPSTKTVVKQKKVKKAPVISSDEEDNDIKIFDEKKTPKSSKKTSRQQIISDSDDESPVASTKNDASRKKQSQKKKEEPEMKAVSVKDMLGKTPVKRLNYAKVSHKENGKKTEADFHGDDGDDFEATLGQVDLAAIEANYFKDTEEKNGSGKRKKDHQDEAGDHATPKKAKLEPKDTDKKSKNTDLKRPSPKKDETNSPDTHAKRSKVETHTKKKEKTKGNYNIEVEVSPKEKKSKSKAASEEQAAFLEERALKKKQSTALYQAYLTRGGARNPGSKTIPDGAPNCLAGLSFVITGVLESLEREEAADLIKKYGGRVMAGLSKKINYIVVGEEAGQTKLAKAQSLMIKQISEDELLDLIRKKPAGKAGNIIPSKAKSRLDKSPEARKSPVKSPEKKAEIKSPRKPSPTKIVPKDNKVPEVKPDPQKLKITEPTKSLLGDCEYFGSAKALVEKYRPKTMKQIIGQHGDSSNARKLNTWLSNWHKNRGKDVKLARPSLYAKNDNGAYFKACLLSGPPGVGKTTTVQVVCDELGFDLLEFNASDTRSKKLLKEEVSGLLSNTTMKGYFTGNTNEKPTTKHILLMDEVDGMAGNEDRGGLQELIALIKSTDIPIVCICNDRNNPKMRTLANYVFDLRFQKPRAEQIRGAMKSLCFKENIKISTENLDRLIEATNHDIRQIINHLAMLIGDSVIKNQSGTEQSSKLNKDLKLGPWDVVRKVFSSEEHKTMTIHDKSDLFFHDYNIAGLFVQENYLSVMPNGPKNQILDKVAESADSLSLGDQVEKAIRGRMAWSLLPMQACYSSVIPGSVMSGHMAGQINFPSWLGKNSRTTKFNRLLQEITGHTRLATGASKEAINMDYLKPLRDAITMPLIVDHNEGVERSLEIMNHYHLLREDLDSLVEVSLWPGYRDPMQSIESKVKAAFTRAYNKSSAPVPFVVKTTVSKKKRHGSQDDGFIDDDEEDIDSEGEDDNVDVDKMIKAKKPSASKATASTSKGQAKAPSKRGRGRGK